MQLACENGIKAIPSTPTTGSMKSVLCGNPSSTNDSNKFKISGEKLSFLGDPDADGSKIWTITVRATDERGACMTKDFTIPTYRFPIVPTTTFVRYSGHFEEINPSIPITIGELKTADPNLQSIGGDTFTYKLLTHSVPGGLQIDADQEKFLITGNKLSLTEQWDCTAKRSYSPKIRTTDKDGQTEDIALSIENAYGPYPLKKVYWIQEITNLSQSTSIGGPRIRIDYFSNWDCNANPIFTYTPIGSDTDDGIDNWMFYVDSNGGLFYKIFANSCFQVEYHVSYRITDIDGGSVDKKITIKEIMPEECASDDSITGVSLSEFKEAENYRMCFDKAKFGTVSEATITDFIKTMKIFMMAGGDDGNQEDNKRLWDQTCKFLPILTKIEIFRSKVRLVADAWSLISFFRETHPV